MRWVAGDEVDRLIHREVRCEVCFFRKLSLLALKGLTLTSLQIGGLEGMKGYFIPHCGCSSRSN